MTFKTALLLIPLIASGCAATSTRPDFCAVYEAVPTLHCGTAAQAMAVDRNNAVYRDMCR